MDEAYSRPGARLTRFDLGVALVMLLLVSAVLSLVALGDQAGLAVTIEQPRPGAADVSNGTVIRLTFGEPMSRQLELELELVPEAAGVGRWQGNTYVFRPFLPLQPETTYTVSVAGDIRSVQGRPLKGPLTWQFRTRQAQIVYIGWDRDNRDQLFLVPSTGGNGRQLTQAEVGLIDFAVAPGGDRLIFAALRPDGGSDLWLVSPDAVAPYLALDCAATIPQAACSGGRWLPGSNRVMYERRTILEPGAPPGPPRLYWLDLASGLTAPVFSDSQWLGLGAAFSPDGQWLSYVSPQDPGVRVFNLETGEDILIPTPTGQPGWWAPDSQGLIVTDMQLRHGEGFAMHMVFVDLATRESLDLSGDADVEDGPPAWPQDGERLAFGRKAARTPMGKQIWLLPRGSAVAVALTDEVSVHHGSLSWSPDGRLLLFQRYDLTEPGARPGIWLLDPLTGEQRLIAPAGSQPAWLP